MLPCTVNQWYLYLYFSEPVFKFIALFTYVKLAIAYFAKIAMTFEWIKPVLQYVWLHLNT